MHCGGRVTNVCSSSGTSTPYLTTRNHYTISRETGNRTQTLPVQVVATNATSSFPLPPSIRCVSLTTPVYHPLARVSTGIFFFFLSGGEYLPVMSAVALKLAQQMVDGASGVDTLDLFINVIHQDSDLLFVEYGYKGQKTQQTGFHATTQQGAGGQKVQGDLEAELAPGNKGAKGECLSSYIIRSVSARPQGGWGRLLYYVAMHYAGEHGITADREKSSSDAVGAWNNIARDPAVSKKPLDDVQNPQTPGKEDDCNLASSGLYGHEKSRDSYEHNPMLSYGDERNMDPDDVIDGKVSEKERLARGDEYRKTKGSTLNFVYYAQIPDVIAMLTKAGKLVVDNQQLSENVSLYNMIYHNRRFSRRR